MRALLLCVAQTAEPRVALDTSTSNPWNVKARRGGSCFVAPACEMMSPFPGIWRARRIKNCMLSSGSATHCLLVASGWSHRRCALCSSHLRATASRVTCCMILSQRLIHPWLRRWLLEHGVLPLQRLSLRHITAMRAVTGARPLSSWAEADVAPEALGAVSRLEMRTLHERRFLWIQA